MSNPDEQSSSESSLLHQRHHAPPPDLTADNRELQHVRHVQQQPVDELLSAPGSERQPQQLAPVPTATRASGLQQQPDTDCSLATSSRQAHSLRASNAQRDSMSQQDRSLFNHASRVMDAVQLECGVRDQDLTPSKRVELHLMALGMLNHDHNYRLQHRYQPLLGMHCSDSLAWDVFLRRYDVRIFLHHLVDGDNDSIPVS